MGKSFIFGLGAVLLITGCIGQAFKKSSLNVIAEVLGFCVMLFAYVI